MEPQTSSKKTIGIALGIVVVVIIFAVIIFSGKNTSEQAPANDQTSGANATPTPASSASSTPAVSDNSGTQSSTYKDGTYSATGSYLSPGGPDQIAVTLTLKDDIITDITATPMPGDRTSSKYQGIFVANFKQYVVGQDISTVHLTKVSGFSLTSGGFNDALAQIEAQAKA